MPKRRTIRKAKRPIRKRRFKKRSVIPSSLVPRSMVRKLKWTYADQLNGGAGTVDSLVFRTNNLYDPLYAAGGEQPRGYDQLGALYSYYTVLGARITVKYTANVDGENGNIGGVFLTRNPAEYTSAINYIEQPLCRYATLPSGQSRTLTMNFSTKKFFSLANVKDNEDYKALINSNPTNTAYFILFAGNASSASDLGAVNFIATIEFIALFTEPVQLAQS